VVFAKTLEPAIADTWMVVEVVPANAHAIRDSGC